MDLIAVHAPDKGSVGEGDWLSMNFDLAALAGDGPLSQYELLTTLGNRFEQVWA
jgi:alanine racemase